jgi:hypothetical protein
MQTLSHWLVENGIVLAVLVTVGVAEKDDLFHRREF